MLLYSSLIRPLPPFRVYLKRQLPPLRDLDMMLRKVFMGFVHSVHGLLQHVQNSETPQGTNGAAMLKNTGSCMLGY